MTDIPEFHLCPESWRLYNEWHNNHVKMEECPWLDDKYQEITKLTNAAWTAYQDHRAACDSCTKVRAA